MSCVIGWDVGGAHLKAALWFEGELRSVVQWPCPLWQGLHHLDDALERVRERWPAIRAGTGVVHAVTMTGETADMFADREDGVRRITAFLDRALAGARYFSVGAGWLSASDVPAHWRDVAAANWLATAKFTAAAHPGPGLLVDIGSTTTDLIAFTDGRVRTTSRTDHDRLCSGELAYHGIVRTPLCALARRAPWQGRIANVMNEEYATTADVYRLCGELDERHDQQAAADGGAKDIAGSEQRIARMIGLDRRDGTHDEWRAFARFWREAQRDELRGHVQRALDAAALPPTATVVAAGCGSFLVPELAPQANVLRFGRDLVRAADPEAAGWAEVCAPAVAVAGLWLKESA